MFHKDIPYSEKPSGDYENFHLEILGNTLRPKQNGYPFPNDIFLKFPERNVWISIIIIWTNDDLLH